MYNEGISRSGDVLDLAAARDIVEKSGAWYAYNGEKIGQGREASKTYLMEHPKIMEELAKKVMEHDKPKPPVDKKPIEDAPAKDVTTEDAGDVKGSLKPAKAPKAVK
jgi:recombination protein RecA